MGRFQKHIFVCVNERPKEHPKGCCLHKGSAEVREKFKDELQKRGLASIVRANNAGCLDACEYGVSVVVYPEGVWYGGVQVNDVEEVIQEHILNGRIVERLTIKNSKYQTNATIEPIKQ